MVFLTSSTGRGSRCAYAARLTQMIKPFPLAFSNHAQHDLKFGLDAVNHEGPPGVDILGMSATSTKRRC